MPLFGKEKAKLFHLNTLKFQNNLLALFTSLILNNLDSIF